jgi:hypothetical protein
LLYRDEETRECCSSCRRRVLSRCCSQSIGKSIRRDDPSSTSSTDRSIFHLPPSKNNSTRPRRVEERLMLPASHKTPIVRDSMTFFLELRVVTQRSSRAIDFFVRKSRRRCHGYGFIVYACSMIKKQSL